MAAMRTHHLAAIDLGASSGRVMLATFTRQEPDSAATLTLKEIHRFPNNLTHTDGMDTWDLDDLEKHILEGLNRLDASGIPLDGIGIDTWGVDFVFSMNRVSGWVRPWRIATAAPTA